MLFRSKTNVDINKSLAELLEERGEYQRAVECWQRVLKVDSTNGEARSKITALSAKSVLDRGGYEGADSTKGVMAAHEVAKRLGKNRDADGPGASMEADLQRAIRKEPENKDNYLKLADYYRREGPLEKAEEPLQKALEVSGNDINIREQLEDVQIDLMRKTPSAELYLRADKPIDFDVYMNRNYAPHDLAAIERDSHPADYDHFTTAEQTHHSLVHS